MNDSAVNVKPFSYALHLINGKWKMYILFWLWKEDVMRYGALKRALGSVTHKMLSSQLQELESDGRLMPVLQAVCRWGEDHYRNGEDNADTI